MACTQLGAGDINKSNDQTGSCHYITSNLLEYTKKKKKKIAIQEYAKLVPSQPAEQKIYSV